MSDKRNIEMPVALIVGAQVIFERERKPTWITVRSELVMEVPSVAAADAPVAAVAEIAERPAARGFSRQPAQTVEYRNIGGRMFAPARSWGDGALDRPIDEALLRRILACRRGDTPPHNDLGIETSGYSPVGGPKRTNFVYRPEMATLDQVAAQKPFKEVLDDGMAEANRIAAGMSADLALVEGVLWKTGPAPVYGLKQAYGDQWQVVVPRSLSSSETAGAHLFDPRRLHDAEAMCARVAKRHRRDVAPRIDAVRIIDHDLFVLDEPALVMGHGMTHLWKEVGALLNVLPTPDLVRWARLRDLENSLDRDPGVATATMVAFRDFVAGLRALDLAPYYEDRREEYLRMVADPLHRVEMDLARLGLQPGDGLAAPDENALADLAAPVVSP